MIHRVVYGSIERFIGILIEHFAGAFPTWLAPVQAVVIPIKTDSEAQMVYAKELMAKLDAAGIRAKLDDRNETLGYRIREQQGQKVPYMLVIGDKEAESNMVSVRDRKDREEFKNPVTAEDFILYAADEIKERRL